MVVVAAASPAGTAPVAVHMAAHPSALAWAANIEDTDTGFHPLDTLVVAKYLFLVGLIRLLVCLLRLAPASTEYA